LGEMFVELAMVFSLVVETRIETAIVESPPQFDFIEYCENRLKGAVRDDMTAESFEV
jgi:hypothetical protein